MFKLNSITIRNYKNIHSSYVTFDNNLTLITGYSGKGKTNFLDAISIIIVRMSTPLPRLSTGMVYVDDLKNALDSFNSESDWFISASVNYAEKKYLAIECKKASVLEAKKTEEKYDEMQEILLDKYNRKSYLPVFRYFTENRYSLTELISAYLDFVKSTPDEGKCFRSLINTFFAELEENDNAGIYTNDEGKYQYFDGQKYYDLNSCGSGIRSLLYIITDLAAQATFLNTTLPSSNRSIQGLVLIDGIEQNLHPEYQWKVIPALRKTFPSVQFIVSTVSPMVISSASECEIINVNDGEFITLSDAYGYDTGDILELKLGSRSLPSEFKAAKAKIDECIDNNDKDALQKTETELKLQYGEKSSLYQRVKEYVSVNDWRIDACE